MNKTIVYSIRPAYKDERGEILDILESDVRHTGMVTFSRKGVVRGNHYHKKSTQYSYVLSGRIKLITLPIKGGKKREFMLRPGSFAKIPPKIIHVYKSLTKAAMLDMTTESRKKAGYEQDTIRVSGK